MSNRNEIVICLGSSCFARGNKQIVQHVKKFLEEHRLAHRVMFRGKHCFGNCENGPSMMIGEKRFEHISADTINDILESQLL
jgi:NADH:ubiquinone oxidoreductase subunit E